MNTNPVIIYVTREIERALGTEPNELYYVVSNKTKYGESVQKKYPQYVILVEPNEKGLLGTTDLLAHTKTKELISLLRGSIPIAETLSPNPYPLTPNISILAQVDASRNLSPHFHHRTWRVTPTLTLNLEA